MVMKWGDKVLIHIANCMHSCIRNSDYIIRWGGEEFLVILPEASLEKSCENAEKIRAAVEKSDSEVCKVTISIGVSLYKGGEYEKTVSLADDALYRAKEQGRNKVCRST